MVQSADRYATRPAGRLLQQPALDTRLWSTRRSAPAHDTRTVCSPSQQHTLHAGTAISSAQQVSHGFEPRSLDSGSRVLTVTPRDQLADCSGSQLLTQDSGARGAAPRHTTQGQCVIQVSSILCMRAPPCPALSRSRADLSRDRWIQGPEC